MHGINRGTNNHMGTTNVIINPTGDRNKSNSLLTCAEIANVIAALAFAAGHLPTAMLLLSATTPANIPTLVLAEVFLLNGLVGVVAGERYMRDGLIAAAGVHFWTDIIWHVIWPLIG